jgi:hypothetical protein
MLKRQLRPLKTSSKTCISVEVQGLGPWRGLGQRPNLACFIGQWFGCGICSTHNTNPAKRVRAWARSGTGGAGRIRNGRFEVCNGNKQTFIHRDCPMQFDPHHGGQEDHMKTDLRT